MHYLLDSNDKKILAQLDSNARMTYKEISKKTRIPKETVKYRIEKLEKEKIILGYWTVIDYAKRGMLLYRLYVKFQNNDPNKEKQLIDFLVARKEVKIVFRFSGSYDVALGIFVKSHHECEQFLDSLRKQFNNSMARTHLSLFTSYVEYSKTYLFGGEKQVFETCSRSKPVLLDETDERILTLLEHNARISLVELAKKCNVTLATVRSHLRLLLKQGVIVGFRPLLNLEKLGYVYYKVDLFFNTPNDQFIRHVLSHPNVAYTEKSLISSDFEFDVEVQTHQEFISIMNSFAQKFPGVIREYSYYTRTEQLK